MSSRRRGRRGGRVARPDLEQVTAPSPVRRLQPRSIRDRWSPLWAEVLGIRPWEMDDLTPAEFDTCARYLADVSKRRQQQVAQGGGGPFAGAVL